MSTLTFSFQSQKQIHRITVYLALNSFRSSKEELTFNVNCTKKKKLTFSTRHGLSKTVKRQQNKVLKLTYSSSVTNLNYKADSYKVGVLHVGSLDMTGACVRASEADPSPPFQLHKLLFLTFYYSNRHTRPILRRRRSLTIFRNANQNARSVCLLMEIYTLTERADFLPYNGNIYTHRTRRVSAL